MADSHPPRVPEDPRHLNAAEKAIALALLNHADFEEHSALLPQVDTASVVSHCGCGCATVDMAVETSEPETPSRPIPNEAAILDDAGQPTGGVMLFVKNGQLAGLEFYSYRDEPIRSIPPITKLRLLPPTDS